MAKGYVRLKLDSRGNNLLIPIEGGSKLVYLHHLDGVNLKPGDIVEYEIKSISKSFIESDEYKISSPSKFDLVIRGKLGKPDFIYGSWDGRKGLFRWERVPWRTDKKIFGKDYAVTVSGQLDLLLDRVPEINDVSIDDSFRSFGNCSFTESLMDRRNMIARKILRDILRERNL